MFLKCEKAEGLYNEHPSIQLYQFITDCHIFFLFLLWYNILTKFTILTISISFRNITFYIQLKNLYGLSTIPFPSSLEKWSEVKWLSHVQLCNPMDCSPPGSSAHGIFQARILEWVATSFSRVSSRPRDWTQVSCITGRLFTIWSTRNPTILNLILL